MEAEIDPFKDVGSNFEQMVEAKQHQQLREDKTFNADIEDSLMKGKNLVRKIRSSNRSPTKDDSDLMSATFSVQENPPKTGRLKTRAEN